MDKGLQIQVDLHRKGEELISKLKKDELFISGDIYEVKL